MKTRERLPMLLKIAILQLLLVPLFAFVGFGYEKNFIDGVSGDFIAYADMPLLLLMPALAFFGVVVGLIWLASVHVRGVAPEKDQTPAMIGIHILILISSPVTIASLAYLFFTYRALG